MELSVLVEALRDRGAFPVPADVQVIQTHISIVALVGEWVYKLRKPVVTRFLDFRTLEQRRQDCENEVRLNRRLAPEVYIGVVPVVAHGNGVRVEGDGEPIEWAVKMRRLPQEMTLLRHLQRGHVDEGVIIRLARHLASFHNSAAAEPHMADYGRSAYVLRNALDNFDESRPFIDSIINVSLLDYLRSCTERLGRDLTATMDRRVEQGRIRDTHGDLHLDHVYWFPDQPAPHDFVIIDCVEFNERFRFADPIADMAFLVMDLGFRGRRDLADAFADAYFASHPDPEGQTLLRFYTSYRASVRAKVEGMKSREAEVSESDRQKARLQSQAHWLYALGELAEPRRKPLLLLFGGLPGSGKSTVARSLADSANFVILRSDVIRKEIATATDTLYSEEMNQRTYAECLERARSRLLAGERVIVDANFPRESWRLLFLELADSLAVPVQFVHCQVEAALALARLAARRNDASDADGQVYQRLVKDYEPLGAQTRTRCWSLDTGHTVEQSVERLQQELRQREWLET